MIIVDNALKAQRGAGRPIRVGMVGAGFMGQGLTNQITNSVPGMRMAAIYNRKPERAEGVYRYSGLEDVVRVDTQAALDAAIAAGRPAVAEDPMLICRSDADRRHHRRHRIGGVRRQRLHRGVRHGKHVVMMNAEVDATIGPILQTYAKRAGVTLSACDGDEPGLQMNLVRWVAGLGLIPRVVCNIKGLQDPYRNPTTQQAWAERWEQNPAMVTSFADGSKISFEQTIVANASGLQGPRAGDDPRRGLRRLDHGHRPAATTSTSSASSAASSTTRSGRPA